MKPLVLAVVMTVVLAGCTPAINNALNGGVTPTPAVSPTPEIEVDDQTNTGDQVNDAMDTLDEKASVKTVTLQAQNNSGQSGTAVLTEMDDSTVKVILNMRGGSFTAPQPAHIHVGVCPNPGAVQYPLTNVVNGSSETTLNVNMDTLMASADQLAINVHKSAAEASVYTACGNVK
jgi:hypothetical protein